MKNSKETLKEYLEQIKEDLLTHNISLSKNQISSMLEENELCEKNEIASKAILIKVITNLYGVNIDNLETDFFDVVYNSIIENCKSISLVDLQEAFKSIVIEKRAFVSLTRDEILNPIKQYWIKKKIVISKLNKCMEEAKENMENMEKELIFYNQSKIIYIESLKNGVWLGDEFHANQIARNFKNLFTDESKKELWIKAQIEFNKRSDPTQNEIYWSIIPKEKIYADFMIQECIKLKINFIEKNIQQIFK